MLKPILLQADMNRLLCLALMFLAFGVLKAQNSASDLPVKVTFRQSLLKPGTFVIQFRNDGDKSLVLHTEIDRASGGARNTFTLMVPPNGKKEIGKLQGWEGMSGDQIRIQCEGYSEADVHIP